MYAKKITKKNVNNAINNVICNSANLGLIKQTDFFDKEIAVENNTSGYYIICQGDFVYNPRKSIGAPYGPVNIYKMSDPGIVSPLYLCFSVNNINSDFLLYHFKSSCWHRYVYLNGDSGARHDRVSIKDSAFLNQPLYIPVKEEQIKLANFLKSIERRIETQNKIIKDLFSYKNALIDYMIKNLENEKLTISEFIKKSYARIIKPSELTPFCGQKKYISTSCVDENGIISVDRLITYNDRPSRASMKPIINSIWFAKMKNSIKVYKSVNDDENQYVLSTGFYGILCDNNKVEKNWVLEVFRSKYFNNQKDRFSEGSSMSGIKDNQLNDIKVPLFKNKKNEKNAAILLTKISKKILCEKELLNRYLRQKTYLLQNLFI